MCSLHILGLYKRAKVCYTNIVVMHGVAVLFSFYGVWVGQYLKKPAAHAVGFCYWVLYVKQAVFEGGLRVAWQLAR